MEKRSNVVAEVKEKGAIPPERKERLQKMWGTLEELVRERSGGGSNFLEQAGEPREKIEMGEI